MQITPIGIIHSPFKIKKETPLQPSCSNAVGKVEVFKKFEGGLQDITGFSHLIFIYHFHKSRGYKLLVKPFLDNQLRGLFSTRYPRCPNQLGISVVQLIKKKGNVLYVKGIDVLDGTPLLDIKPYAPFFTVPAKIKTGWMKKKWEAKKFMKIGVIISSNDAETCWNALRYANFCIVNKDVVKVFFMGKGVEYQKIGNEKFNTTEQVDKFLKSGGKIYACGTCIKAREQKESDMCPISTMEDMYAIVKDSDKVISF